MNFEMTPEKTDLAFSVVCDAILIRSLIIKKVGDGILEEDCIKFVEHFTEGVAIFMGFTKDFNTLTIEQKVMLKKTSGVLAREIIYLFDQIEPVLGIGFNSGESAMILAFNSNITEFFMYFEDWFIKDFLPSLSIKEIMMIIVLLAPETEN